MNMLQAPRPVYEISRQIDQEKPRLIRFISNKIGDTSYSEDIYQEALERSLKRFMQGFIPVDPISYIYRVILNLINDYHQSEQPMITTQSILDDDDELPCEKPQPDHHAESQQKLQMFMDCLNSLPAETGNMLVMCKLHGLSNSEIARRLGRTPKAVEKRINRAMISIKEQIERGIPSQNKNKRKWF